MSYLIRIDEAMLHLRSVIKSLIDHQNLCIPIQVIYRRCRRDNGDILYWFVFIAIWEDICRPIRVIQGYEILPEATGIRIRVRFVVCYGVGWGSGTAFTVLTFLLVTTLEILLPCPFPFLAPACSFLPPIRGPVIVGLVKVLVSSRILCCN